jgi:hypothetical protein
MEYYNSNTMQSEGVRIIQDNVMRETEGEHGVSYNVQFPVSP